MLIPIAQELQLPIALKLGAHRQVNPLLRSGGVRACVDQRGLSSLPSRAARRR